LLYAPIRRYTISMQSWVQKLSPDLFWDVNPSGINADTHARWLLERVLERGRWEDWLAVREHYGKDILRDIASTLRVDPGMCQGTVRQ
jgi:hypothetical protein